MCPLKRKKNLVNAVKFAIGLSLYLCYNLSFSTNSLSGFVFDYAYRNLIGRRSIKNIFRDDANPA